MPAMKALRVSLASHAVALVVLSGCGPAPAAKIIWQNYDSPEFGFSVLMPGQATHSLDPEDPDEHKHRVILDNGNFVCMVDHFSMTSGDRRSIDQIFSEVRKNMTTKYKITSERRVEVNGIPGLELLMRTPDEDPMFYRVYYANGRCYQVIAVATNGASYGAEAVRFLGSFQFLGTPTAFGSAP